MNVEFQIHGVLSSGQKIWKQEDQDYYKQFYSDQTEDVLMIVEIVKRPHGVSAYYNYLRYNNILSEREGSYFGMTMRIDGVFCRDVKSVYMILDNLFNKTMVGHLLVPNGDKYEYAIDSFADQNEYLQQVEKQFVNMLSAFCSEQDFFEISPANTSKREKQPVNAWEVTIPMTEGTISQRAKLYLSPFYQSETVQRIIAQAKQDAGKAVAAAEERINAAENARLQSEQEQQTSSKNWRQEKERLEGELKAAKSSITALERKVDEAALDAAINAQISEIKGPLMQLAGLMAKRFPEATNGNIQEEPQSQILSADPVAQYSPKEANGNNQTRPQTPEEESKKKKLPAWSFWAIGILLVIALAGIIWYMDPGKSPDKTSIGIHDERPVQLEDSINNSSFLPEDAALQPEPEEEL